MSSGFDHSSKRRAQHGIHLASNGHGQKDRSAETTIIMSRSLSEESNRYHSENSEKSPSNQSYAQEPVPTPLIEQQIDVKGLSDITEKRVTGDRSLLGCEVATSCKVETTESTLIPTSVASNSPLGLLHGKMQGEKFSVPLDRDILGVEATHNDVPGATKEKITFLLRPPVSPSEIDTAEHHIRTVVNAAYKVYKSTGTTALRSFLKSNEIHNPSGEFRKKQDKNMTSTSEKQKRPLEEQSKQVTDKKSDKGSKLEEHVIEYDSSLPQAPLPCHKNIVGLFPSRGKDLDQLELLNHELGPLVVAKYCTVLLRELSRDHHETKEQFLILLKHINYIRKCCLGRCANQSKGKSAKLIATEERLKTIYDTNVKNTAFIFVQRKITALALKNHFSTSIVHEGDSFERLEETGNSMVNCEVLTKKNTHVFKYLSLDQRLKSESKPTSLDEKVWLHTSLNDCKSILEKFRRCAVNLLITIPNNGSDLIECSHVLFVDTLGGKKGFDRMRDRARQLHAQLIIFQSKNGREATISIKPEITEKNTSNELSIISDDDASDKSSVDCDTDSKTTCIHLQSSFVSKISNPIVPIEEKDIFLLEEAALESGQYIAPRATVDIFSSQTILRKYISSIPVSLR